MQIIATSDIHGYLPEIPPCDLFLIAGDLQCAGPLKISYPWWKKNLMQWFNNIPAQKILFIAGNHDICLGIPEQKNRIINDLLPQVNKPVYYLEDSLIEVNGLRIYGSPWVKRINGKTFQLDPKDLMDKWVMIPNKIDILLTHSPPYNIGDANYYGERLGCVGLARTIAKVQPKYHIFGHVHEGYGLYRMPWGDCMNVSYCKFAKYMIPTNEFNDIIEIEI